MESVIHCYMEFSFMLNLRSALVLNISVKEGILEFQGLLAREPFLLSDSVPWYLPLEMSPLLISAPAPG